MAGTVALVSEEKMFEGMYSCRKSTARGSWSWLVLKNEADGHCGKASGNARTTRRPSAQSPSSRLPALRASAFTLCGICLPIDVIMATRM
jgi:hypothetical protein